MSSDEILEKYSASIRRVAASYVGPGAMREDLEQDIALAVVKAAPGFRGEAAMGTYVYRIAQNCGIDFLKSRKMEVVEFKEERHQVARPNPEQEVLSDEKSEILAAAIRTLPLAIRQPLVLRLEGLSYQEIADITELTVSNVGVRIHRATQALKVELGSLSSTVC